MNQLNASFPQAAPDDLVLTFRETGPGKLPLEWAAIKTESGFEDLHASMAELGSGILLAVQSVRCCDETLIFRPLDQRGEELEGYRKRSCIFRRNGDPNSNFFTVEATGGGTVWIQNRGDRSLRFQMPDGQIYRVCAGHTEALALSNLQAQTAPTQILLDVGGNSLDLRVGAIYMRYGQSPWQRGGADCLAGAHVDSYFCRVFCGDDCLGVLESYSDYFLERPRLEFLDIETYGPSQWFVRNKGTTVLTLTWPDGRAADVPADGQVYRLETLTAYKKEESA